MILLYCFLDKLAVDGMQCFESKGGANLADDIFIKPG